MGERVSDRRGKGVVGRESPLSKSVSSTAIDGSDVSIPSAVPERAPALGTISIGALPRF